MPNLILPENEAVFSLFKEIKTLIENAQKRVAMAVNAELSLLNWHIGRQMHILIFNKKLRQ